MQLINIGFGNIILAERIIAIISPDSAPVKRMIQESKDNGKIMDSGHIILSAVQPETVAGRLTQGNNILTSKESD